MPLGGGAVAVAAAVEKYPDVNNRKKIAIPPRRRRAVLPFCRCSAAVLPPFLCRRSAAVKKYFSVFKKKC
jgi:hypothetical protein